MIRDLARAMSGRADRRAYQGEENVKCKVHELGIGKFEDKEEAVVFDLQRCNPEVWVQRMKPSAPDIFPPPFCPAHYFL